MIRAIAVLGLALGCFGIGISPASGQVTLPPVNLGSTSFLDGVAWPGWLVQQTVSYYAGPRFRGADGRRLDRPDDLAVAAGVTHIAYLSSLKLFGAHVGAEVLLPVVRFDLDVAPAVGRSGTGIGDLIVGPLILQWNGHSVFGRPFHHRLAVNVALPTGAYDGGRLANAGHGTWQFNPHWAFTWMASPRWEVSGRMHYLWVSENDDPPASLDAKTVQAGRAVHANLSFSREVMDGVRVGVSGYVLKQVSDDEIDDVEQSGSREQVIGLGPGLSWEMGRSTLFLNMYMETAVRNRPQGARFFVRWSHPL